MSEIKVLGIDLASRGWKDTGSAVLKFSDSPQPEWIGYDLGAIPWPQGAFTPSKVAEVIDSFAKSNRIAAISLDGPQGWREPAAAARKGVGRLCEFEARTPGKTGEYGRTFPGTYGGWVRFSIDVFHELMKQDLQALVNTIPGPPLVTRGESYYLLECFPTSTWRTSGLRPLPGHRNAPPDVVRDFLQKLCNRFGLPQPTLWNGNHDDLQALVAAIPAAALLGGPCVAIARGKPGRFEPANSSAVPTHWVEGFIWDATSVQPPPLNSAPVQAVAENAVVMECRDFDNPVLLDERDLESEEALETGAVLFRELVRRANQGESVGVSYDQFVRLVYGATNFGEVVGRTYKPSDSGFVIRLASLVTEAAGGRLSVVKNGTTIAAGMDTFIWQKRPPHERSEKAWQSNWCQPPYSRADWRAVFPDGTRQLL